MIKRLSFVVFISFAICFCVDVYAESLFDESAFRPLTSDRKAFQVGDNVTVLIVESAKAGASTDAQVNQSLEASGSFSKSNRSDSGSLELGIGRNSGGSTQREGELKARITVAILETDNNGRFHIWGDQKITINGEEQSIKLSGWIRDEDISSQNTVLSTRISDAKIEYDGVGLIGDTDDRGIIYWVLTKVGLI
ncbi:flagellar basal body L-ring protein [Hahella sp. CCB-MM4]|uniref:flagellar basal body L-ring protein FlgH n=1 Tax=Hahella sp. (strain CCB-MM4) TaxID=1926491 RepID=UPI000B9B0B80|nr:flagellar basal body L-ring protein FlgH [Hahella sp. CCB-MM4]OZG74850.1 flagellar basal body L-ring protein [Hahella sp. CCB-MM4]